MDSKELISEICKDRISEKKDLISELAVMQHEQVEQFIKEIKKLVHHKDTTCGLFALDCDPKDLLHQFWQSSSDQCPLECTESEKQEQDFEDWITDLCFQIEY